MFERPPFFKMTDLLKKINLKINPSNARINSQILMVILLSLSVLGATMAIWTRASVLNREFEMVREKHLLISYQMSNYLDKYLQNVSVLFDEITNNEDNRDELPFLEMLDISAVRTYDADGNVKFDYNPRELYIPFEIIADLILQIEGVEASGTVVFSDLINNNGDEFFLLIKKTLKDRFIAGRLELDYIRQLQDSIQFGEFGSSAIFDNKGTPIAYPMTYLEDGAINSWYPPYSQQINESDVDVDIFYSPYHRKVMIAGLTSVGLTGWVISVQQPIEEIVDEVYHTSFRSFMVLALFLSTSAMLGMFLSRSISGPIEKFADLSIRLAQGDSAVDLDDSVLNQHYGSFEMDNLRKALQLMIQHFRTANKNLKDALEIKDNSTKSKNNFLVSASHELKNPLSAVRGMLAVATETNKDPEIEQFLRIASSSAKMTDNIIDELLLFSSEQRGSVRLSIEPVLLKDFCDDLVQVHQRKTNEKELEFNKTFNFRRRVRIMTDYTKLSQVLNNIFNNSLKYTNEGSIFFSVSLRELSSLKNDELIFVISDTGIGISEEHIQYVFDPFYQAETSYSRSYTGLGLGLSIVRKICDRLGGSIVIESKTGQGTSVTLTFPVVVATT